MNLDIGTVLICSLLIGAAVTLFSWSLTLGSGAPPWRWTWAWGNTALLAGVALLLTQGRVSPWVSVILANGLVIFGYHLLEEGLRRFAGRPSPGWLRWTSAAVFLVGFVLFTLVWDLFDARVVVYTVLVAAVWVRIVLILRRLPESRWHPVLVRSFMALCSLILFAQAGRALVTIGEGGRTLLGPNDALALMLLISVVVIVAWSLGFITLDIYRHQRNLETTLETRDRMMQLIAHDLRGPLGGQMGLLDLMRTNGQCREDGGELLDLLAVSSQTSFELLDNLLDWAKGQQGTLDVHPEILDVSEVVHQVIEPYATTARTKAITLVLDLEPAGRVLADRRTLETILRNLVSNAIKFTPPGKTIRVAFQTTGGKARFQVEDSGPGMSNEVLHLVNEGRPLRSTPGTAREEGSGLGLRLCRDCARLNGGTLRFTASPNGTVATLELEVVPKK